MKYSFVITHYENGNIAAKEVEAFDVVHAARVFQKKFKVMACAIISIQKRSRV